MPITSVITYLRETLVVVTRTGYGTERRNIRPLSTRSYKSFQQYLIMNDTEEYICNSKLDIIRYSYLNSPETSMSLVL